MAATEPGYAYKARAITHPLWPVTGRGMRVLETLMFVLGASLGIRVHVTLSIPALCCPQK